MHAIKYSTLSRSGTATPSRPRSELAEAAAALRGATAPLIIAGGGVHYADAAAALGDFAAAPCTKWWGPDRHIVIYYVNPRRDEIYFVTSVPEPGWDIESWSMRGEVDEVRRAPNGAMALTVHPSEHCAELLGGCMRSQVGETHLASLLGHET